MSASTTIEVRDQGRIQLHWQDWVFLPVIGLFTILLVALLTEATARGLLPVSQVGFDNCFVTDDASGDASVKPDSFCAERIAESGYSADYKFNHQGDRDDADLQPKELGTYRVVMIGSSFAMGLFVPKEMTFATLLPAELSRRTGRRVELYNEATGGKYRGGPFPMQSSPSRFSRVLSATPDMILWIITPMDIQNSESDISDPIRQRTLTNAPKQAPEPIGPVSAWKRLENAVAEGRRRAKVRDRWERTRTSLALKHFLIAGESKEQYTESYLKNGLDAECLKTEPSARWRHLLRTFQVEAEEFERQAKTRDIPFIAVLVPNRAEAAMLSMDEWPRGYDPYTLGNELRAIIASHGGTYIDILPGFHNLPNPERHYFPVDGHLDADGHAMIASMLAEKLTHRVMPALRSVATLKGSEGQAQ